MRHRPQEHEQYADPTISPSPNNQPLLKPAALVPTVLTTRVLACCQGTFSE
eukprot:m.73518 g.73518  ORF g.73518 m.73518 type:complete len:51 (+) comp14358_c0_seq1:1242-1394(+)